MRKLPFLIIPSTSATERKNHTSFTQREFQRGLEFKNSGPLLFTDQLKWPASRFHQNDECESLGVMFGLRHTWLRLPFCLYGTIGTQRSNEDELCDGAQHARDFLTCPEFLSFAKK